MSLKYRTSAGTSASDFTDLVVKVGDTLPIGSEIDYDGQSVPAGWQEVDDPNVYSTTETRIGTFLGKPLYRKVVTGTSASLVNYTNLLTGVAKLKSSEGNLLKEGYWIPVNSTFGSSNEQLIRVILNTADNTVILQTTQPYYNVPYEITLEYTKTTD